MSHDLELFKKPILPYIYDSILDILKQSEVNKG